MFFKNKKNETNIVKEIKKNESELRENIELFLGQLDSEEGTKRTKVLNELGKFYFDLNEIDNAIKYYEISINENRSLGQAYTDLTKLYNIKRKEAVDAKDDELVQVYLNKLDDLMKQSKDVIRGL